MTTHTAVQQLLIDNTWVSWRRWRAYNVRGVHPEDGIDYGEEPEYDAALRALRITFAGNEVAFRGALEGQASWKLVPHWMDRAVLDVSDGPVGLSSLHLSLESTDCGSLWCEKSLPAMGASERFELLPLQWFQELDGDWVDDTSGETVLLRILGPQFAFCDDDGNVTGEKGFIGPLKEKNSLAFFEQGSEFEMFSGRRDADKDGPFIETELQPRYPLQLRRRRS